MDVRESRIAVDGGDLVVIDYGGTGHDVLLVHSVCQSSPVWNDVAGILAEHAHVVAVDLRGHGQSTAQPRAITQIPDDLAHLIATLGLDRPVLVGHEVAGGFVAEVAASHPELVGAVVVIDSPVVEPREIVRAMVRAMGTPEVIRDITDRFGFGQTGPDTETMKTFIDEHTERNLGDPLSAAPDERTTRALRERATVARDDGSWVFRPTPEAIAALTADPDTSPFQPGIELLAELQVPVTIVTVTDQRHGAGGTSTSELAARHPSFHLVSLETDSYVLYKDPQGVVSAVLETVEHIG